MRRIAVFGALAGVMAVVLASTVLVVPVSASSPGPSASQDPWAAGEVVIIQLHGTDGAPLTPEQIAATQAVVESRLAAFGGTGAMVRAIPDDRLRIDIADPALEDVVGRVATAPGNLEFIGVPNAYANSIVSDQPVPSGMPDVPLFGTEGIASARLGTTMAGQTAIDIDLQPSASAAFDAYAAAHQGERLAIVLDGRVIEAPTLNATSFNGHVEISGSFDVEGARELIAILAGGVLPVAAEVLIVCPAAGDCPGPIASPNA